MELSFKTQQPLTRRLFLKYLLVSSLRLDEPLPRKNSNAPNHEVKGPIEWLFKEASGGLFDFPCSETDPQPNHPWSLLDSGTLMDTTFGADRRGFFHFLFRTGSDFFNKEASLSSIGYLLFRTPKPAPMEDRDGKQSPFSTGPETGRHSIPSFLEWIFLSSRSRAG